MRRRSQGSDSTQAVQLREDMKTAGGLVLMIDSTEMTGNQRARWVRPLVSATIRLLSSARTSCPSSSRSKWDLVSATARQTKEAATDLLGNLMSAVRDTEHLYGALIPVACGQAPANVILPVLWCLHVGIAVRGASLHGSIEYHGQLAEIAAQRQGLWDDVRSWWRNEPTWRDVQAQANLQIHDDLSRLRPLATSFEKLERLLEPVEKFGGGY